MKILIVGDVHWSTYSSIVRSRGKYYSTRLENLVASINWAECKALEFNCDRVVYLGDFFDKPDLNAEELTAIKDVKWSDLEHYLLVGNHESNVNNLKFASSFTLLNNNFKIITNYTVEGIIEENLNLIYLPYRVEEDRLTLSDLYKQYNISDLTKNIIFSHNDLKMRYGMFESKTGYDLDEIKNKCNLFINGHIHNCGYADDNGKILNLGNLTGQNFSENSTLYPHYIGILDTQTLNIDFIENPFAFNFNKLEINDENELNNFLQFLKTTKQRNLVLTIRCRFDLINKLKNILNDFKDLVIESRIVAFMNNLDDNSDDIEIDTTEFNKIDYLEQFQIFIKNKLGSNDIIDTEVMEVIR